MGHARVVEQVGDFTHGELPLGEQLLDPFDFLGNAVTLDGGAARLGEELAQQAVVGMAAAGEVVREVDAGGRGVVVDQFDDGRADLLDQPLARVVEKLEAALFQRPAHLVAPGGWQRFGQLGLAQLHAHGVQPQPLEQPGDHHHAAVADHVLDRKDMRFVHRFVAPPAREAALRTKIRFFRHTAPAVPAGMGPHHTGAVSPHRDCRLRKGLPAAPTRDEAASPYGMSSDESP